MNPPFTSYKLTDFLFKVRVNDPGARRPLFTSGLIGRDNSVARHGIHGIYWLFSVNIPGNMLVEGENTLFLTQPRCNGPFQGIMYDYIRLEGCEMEYIVLGCPFFNMFDYVAYLPSFSLLTFTGWKKESEFPIGWKTPKTITRKGDEEGKCPLLRKTRITK
ncbi:hypothetical protein SAY87_014098 [Trapa incisa]|uniref:Rhamnogalacturonan lyase domain-containing protein n=1 Tax=Trapa incisa TaxID=236973 RepID=A0AAN7GVL1_9MYRT|nr:hypothetical protein SAY87_014098 [Trapa incisa]